MRRRTRWIAAATIAGLLAGCGNFSLSDILDAPPPGGLPTEPSVLTLVPVTVNVPVSTAEVSTVVRFTAQGGVQPYAWAEDTDGTDGSIDSTGLYTAPRAAGTYTVSVTDSAGAFCESTVMASLTVPLSISPAAISIAAGSSVTFSAIGGSGSYGWSKPQGAGTLTSSLASAMYRAPGFAESAKIRLTDDTLATRDAIVTVTSPPTVLTISPTAVSLTTGQTVSFGAGGGVEPYAYSVLAGGAGGSIEASGVYTAPASAGTDMVRVTDQESLTSDAIVTVYFPLTIVPMEVTVQTGQAYTFSASGGVPPYWYDIVLGGGLIEDSGLYIAPGAEGSAVVEVADSIGNASRAAVIIEASSSWSVVSIDTASKSGQYASLSLEPGTSFPRIAYYESQRKELRLATWSGTEWSVATVDSNDRAGQYASLALEPATAHPRIAYHEAKNGNLMYAAWDGASWSIQLVDSAGDVGQFSSLALTVGGNPRIAYYDATGTLLKYVENNGAGWDAPLIVDTAGDVGQYASLALDAADQPRIAYYDATNKDLKYAAWNGASWVTATVDGATPVTNVGQHASLALEPGTGLPRIACYDAANKDLRYAAWNGTSWVTATVGGAGDVGQYASLTLEPGTGLPRIACYDATNKDLKYAAWDGSSWNIETVDAAGDVGRFASLRLDASGKAGIASYNATAQDLKLAQSP